MELLDLWEIQSFGWSQRGEMRLVWGLETKLVEMRAERNLEAGRCRDEVKGMGLVKLFGVGSDLEWRRS